MKFIVRVLLSGCILSAIGCGNGVALHTAPLTEEQKQQIKEQDKRVDDDERGGSGTASSARRRK